MGCLFTVHQLLRTLAARSRLAADFFTRQLDSSGVCDYFIGTPDSQSDVDSEADRSEEDEIWELCLRQLDALQTSGPVESSNGEVGTSHQPTLSPDDAHRGDLDSVEGLNTAANIAPVGTASDQAPLRMCDSPKPTGHDILRQTPGRGTVLSRLEQWWSTGLGGSHTSASWRSLPEESQNFCVDQLIV